MTDTLGSTPALSAAAAPPIVGDTTVEIADGVFVIPDPRAPLVPNIGIIVGARAALVVDTGLGPRNGGIVHRVTRSIVGDLPLLVTLTHFHPEHGFGVQAFRDATILYNRTQYDEFRQKRDGYLAQFRAFGGAVADQLDGVEFVDPHVVYDGSADLDLGGKRVQLRSCGPAHSRGDQTVFLPAEQVLFTGDLVEDRFYPIFPFFPPYDVDLDANHWIVVIEELQRLGATIVVPGHGAHGDTGLLAVTHEYLTFLRSETKRLAAEGRTAAEIIAIVTPQLQSRYPDWSWDTADTPWRIASGVQTFLAQ
jgi:glyoxylase-like metal-dependent hydrolase (beta-lactamase superfamily II)